LAVLLYGRWKDVLERTLADLEREIAALSDSKDALEQALAAKNLPTEVNVENLVTREGRRDIDVVEDEVEGQLQKVRGHVTDECLIWSVSCVVLVSSLFSILLLLHQLLTIP